MERLSRRQKYEDYREELKKDNEAASNSEALGNYQNKIDQLKNQFEGTQNNPNPTIREIPRPEKQFDDNRYAQKEIKSHDYVNEYKDLFDLLNDEPAPKPVHPSQVFEEPVRPRQNETVAPQTSVIPETQEPIVIDATEDIFEDNNSSTKAMFENAQPEFVEQKQGVREPVNPQPVKQNNASNKADGVEIKNIDELAKEEINSTLTDTIPFVIDDNAVKDAVEEYDIEEVDEEDEEVPNKVLNVILVILIVVLVIVLGLIVYYILAGQGIIG